MMNVKRFFRTYKGIIPWVILILLCVGGVVYGVVPAAKTVWQLVSAREGLQREVAVLRKKSETLAGLDEETLKGQLNVLVSGLPSDKAIPAAFTAVEEAARASSMGLTAVSVANPGSIATESAKKQSSEERKLGSGILPIAVTGEGTLDQVRDFLRRTTGVRRLLRVRFFDVTFLSTEHAFLRVGLDTFYAPLPTGLGDVQAPVEPLTTAEESTIAVISGFPSGNTETPAELPLSPPTRDPFSL